MPLLRYANRAFVRRGTSARPSQRLRSQLRLYTKPASELASLLRVSPEVRDALANRKPVVALESTIYTHGALGRDLPEVLDAVVRRNGAVPATIGVLDGLPTIGLSPDEISRMVDEGASKISRRDFAYIVGAGLKGRKMHGGTTIAGTMLLARAAGIRIFGTGGLGGVHRGGEHSMDVSADLTELGRTRVAVISSGPKGFLDIPRTLEYLETQGVLVGTFADGRTGHVDMPAFWARESGHRSPFVLEDEAQAAAMVLAQERLGMESGLLFANPIPKEHEIPREVMDQIIDTAVREAAEQGFSGSTNTPFILKRIRELSHGRSAPANVHLVQSNVARAARVAVELSKLENDAEGLPTGTYQSIFPVVPTAQSDRAIPEVAAWPKADILVAGSVALDLSCDFHNGRYEEPKPLSPILHTSNPAGISQSIGGVGHNVALAAQRIHRSLKVKLCSLIGSDIAGATILSSMEKNGLDTGYIRQLGPEHHPLARTAQYVAVNDAEKNLMVAMADMAILTSHTFPAHWNSVVDSSKPSWLVVDGNWSAKDIHNWAKTAVLAGAQVAFEPVSTIKAAALFPTGHTLPLFPKPAITLATPNVYELQAMYNAAKEHGYMDSAAWFGVIDAFGMHGGARDRFVRLTSAAATDAGIPVQSIQLLPYIPTILAKMGERGALLTSILKPDDPRLFDPEHERYILTRAEPGHAHVGGVYMRMYPPVEKVENPVSVNGMGDTFLGTLVAGLALGGRMEDLVDIAQQAAVLTLKSSQSVSPDLGVLEGELLAACGRGKTR